ncbi:MAG: hypothetical protein NC543_13195 [bacterium]|nr:hypothetical protein [bacterium]MCM1376344.1 hypothetical protein [Muribaculum sp.]
MNKQQIYISDEESKNCQKVADAFSELFECEDLVVLDAGRYGFVRLQYFKFPFGFDTIDSFYDSKSLFDELWEEWLHTQLINLTADTPMADMEYEDILKCLPEEKRKELLDRRLFFAERTGVENILNKTAPDLWSEEYLQKIKKESENTLEELLEKNISTQRSKGMKKTKKLLDLIVRVRSNKALDRAVEKDRTHMAVSKEQDKAFEELDKAGLNKEQRRIVDRAISITNQCGAIYGMIAYKLGLHDGIRLMSELNKII